jgi:hypothetical protein
LRDDDRRSLGRFPEQKFSSTRGAARPFNPAEDLVGPLLFAFVGGVMGHGPAAFKETDVFHAVRGIAKAIGQLPDSVRFSRDGGFTVIIGKPGDQKSEQINDNEVEDWINKHVHSS